MYMSFKDQLEQGKASGPWTTFHQLIGSRGAIGGMATQGMNRSYSTNSMVGCHSTCCYDCVIAIRSWLRQRVDRHSLLQRQLLLQRICCLATGTNLVIFLALLAGLISGTSYRSGENTEHTPTMGSF